MSATPVTTGKDENPQAAASRVRSARCCVNPQTAPPLALAKSDGQEVCRRWGVVLAGGDGTRLRELTRLVSGDARPKQFCSLFGEGTLLELTRRRAERSIPAARILFPSTSAHRPFYLREQGIRRSLRVVQPANKGTAPPIVHSLLSIQRYDGNALVAILPCDHHYSSESAFTVALESAFDAAARQADSIVLLGSPARAPQTEYGWIEFSSAIQDGDSSFHVRGFWEKPSDDLALRLYRSGALWNTFVMVGHVRAFLDMVRAARTGLLKAFPAEHLWSGREVQIPGWIYDRIYATHFSRDILSLQASRLIARRMDNVGMERSRPTRARDGRSAGRRTKALVDARVGSVTAVSRWCHA